jgi:hypothetical protein
MTYLRLALHVRIGSNDLQMSPVELLPALARGICVACEKPNRGEWQCRILVKARKHLESIGAAAIAVGKLRSAGASVSRLAPAATRP